MPITTDFAEFVEGCKKNNAVDYKVLYEKSQEENKKLKEKLHCDDEGFADSEWFNEKLEKHIECHLSGDGEWGSLGFKNLQDFVDGYDKLEEEIKDKDEIFESMKRDIVSLQKSFERARQNQIQYRSMIKKLTVGIVLTNNDDSFQEEIKISNETSPMWYCGMTRDEAETYNFILDEMNQNDWNEDGGMCYLKYDNESDCIQYFINDEYQDDY